MAELTLVRCNWRVLSGEGCGICVRGRHSHCGGSVQVIRHIVLCVWSWIRWPQHLRSLVLLRSHTLRFYPLSHSPTPPQFHDRPETAFPERVV